MTSADPVFLGYSQAELDDSYDQRIWARDAAGAIALCGRASAATRQAVPHVADLAYGSGPDERLDWFAPPAGDGTIHVHIHGGAWRNMTKEDASFLAPSFLSAGSHFVAVNFSKLPGTGMPAVIEQLAGAMAFIHREARSRGGDPDRIVLSGHSSGAHMAAVLLTLDWAARGLPADLFKAGLLVGGLYDLEPVLLSARRLYITLDAAEAERLSPRRNVAAVRAPIAIVYGGRESPEFIRQSKAFAAGLAAAGKRVELIESPEADHFDLNAALGEPGSIVNRVALEQVAALDVATPARKAAGAG